MENRTEPRVSHHVKFFVHVHECPENPDIEGLSVECDAIDFSTHGMQFTTDTALIPGSILNVTIGIGQPFAMYQLKCEIRWVRGGAEEYFMGVLMREDPKSDFERWKSEFDSIFNAS